MPNLLQRVLRRLLGMEAENRIAADPSLIDDPCYRDLEAYAQQITPDDFDSLPNAEKQPVRNLYYGYRNRLYDRHVELLDEAERVELASGQHPSQSHSRAERAQPIAAEFQQLLMSRGIRARVDLCRYHINLIVLSTSLESGDQFGDVPLFFRGFQVKPIVWTAYDRLKWALLYPPGRTILPWNDLHPDWNPDRDTSSYAAAESG